MIWLCELVTNYFQAYFVVDELPTVPDIELLYYLDINDPTEQSEEINEIGIDIAGRVWKPDVT